MPTATMNDSLDRTFAALAHPARRTILMHLARGTASVTELQKPLAMSQPAVSKHLKVLETAGLISRGKDAQWRPSEVRTETLTEVEHWVNDFRQTWEKRLDRLGDYLAESQRETQQPPSNPTTPKK